jgi:hypothetical protein
LYWRDFFQMRPFRPAKHVNLHRFHPVFCFSIVCLLCRLVRAKYA